MAKARTADYRNVTDVLLARDPRDIGLPMALMLSFLGHFALLVFLAVFKGFGPFWPPKERPKISLGGGAPSVAMVSLPSTAPPPPAVPEVDLPPPPAPDTVELEEPAIDIPEPGAEIEFRLPEPKKAEKKPPEIKKPEVKAPALKGPKAEAAPAKPTRGTLGLATTAGPGGPGGGLGGDGPPPDPGLVFYAERITSLIGEQWQRPYVTSARGTVLDCVIFFAITRDGRTSEVSIEMSSGIPNMDQSALRAVMDAGRLPPLPPTYKQDELTVSFSFQYTAGE